MENQNDLLHLPGICVENPMQCYTIENAVAIQFLQYAVCIHVHEGSLYAWNTKITYYSCQNVQYSLQPCL